MTACAYGRADKYATTSSPKFNLQSPGEGLAWDTSRISEGLLFVTKDNDDPVVAIAASPIANVEYYTTDGVQVDCPKKGMYLVKEHHTDGTVSTRKQIFK